MKRFVSSMVLVALVALSVFTFANSASAEEIKMVGVITKIEIAGKTATVTLKDNKTSKLIPITINDDLTLDKLKDHRIADGDEIRAKYEVVNGKNVSKLFRKTAGC